MNVHPSVWSRQFFGRGCQALREQRIRSFLKLFSNVSGFYSCLHECVYVRNVAQLSGFRGNSHKLTAWIGPEGCLGFFHSFTDVFLCVGVCRWCEVNVAVIKTKADKRTAGESKHWKKCLTLCNMWTDRKPPPPIPKSLERWIAVRVCFQQSLQWPCVNTDPDTRCHWFTTSLPQAPWSRQLIGCLHPVSEAAPPIGALLGANIWSSNNMECAASTRAVSWKV